MNKKALSMIEYLMVFAAIVAALLQMSVYFKRSMEGRLRESTRQLGAETGYVPGGMNSNLYSVSNTHETTLTSNDTVTSSSDLVKQSSREESAPALSFGGED